MIRINHLLTEHLSEQAKKSTRLRTNHNFHTYPEDPFQRMLNAMEPGTYLAPHKHENPDKREVFIIVKGRVLVLQFDALGNISDYVVLDPLKGSFGAEIEAGTFHSIIVLQKGSILFECKDGPYNPDTDKVFATWAPREGDAGTMQYFDQILSKLGISMSDS